MAEGRGGVVKKFLDHTTPSARTNEASRLFLIVQPPLLLLRRGADCCNFQRAPAIYTANPLSQVPRLATQLSWPNSCNPGSDFKQMRAGRDVEPAVIVITESHVGGTDAGSRFSRQLRQMQASDRFAFG